MISVKEVIVVEGRYDRNTLSQVFDAVIVETSGFGVFNDREKLALLRRLAEARGLVVLTDSDGAGFVIRNYLKGALPKEQVEDSIPFMKENTEATIRFYKGAPFSVEAPTFVDLEVIHTEPGFKGDTASNTTKPATVETGFTLQVPLFIEIGDKLHIDTRTGEYLNRV
mgnify:CR=1 FL=1